MATGMVLSVAQTLLSALQCKKDLRDLCSMFGYESQLDELKSTVSTIQAVLLDAESKHQELTNEGRNWIEKLKDAVYDVDDLVDELVTMAHLWKRNKGAKFTGKVRRFFSRYNKWFVAFNALNDIKNMREKFDCIAGDRCKFGFGDVYEPIKRREETGSYVYEQSIIGRDADREAIVDLLLRDSDSSVSYVTIVGIGGLGKTALAQIVYNDDRIRGAFDPMTWVCVSEEFSMKEILTKMLMSTTLDNCKDLQMDQLHKKIGEHISGKKYLLVLDDVWEDRRQEWLDLMNFLVQGKSGSRILVTTRSKGVANVVGDYPVFELQGLSKEDSWLLFKRMAFKEVGGRIDTEIVNIGKRLIKRCSNVPLAIRVAGSLLYGQGKSKWLSLEKADILGKDDVISILKYSYYHLSPSLKSCFSYCALFPKDYQINKQLLISLWSAQGCLKEPSVGGRSPEDVGEEYFMILLQRCFFQETRRDDNEGEIHSFKLHDLIHDLAQEIAGKEYYQFVGQSTLRTNIFHNKIRHLSIGSTSFNSHPLISGTVEMQATRTYLCFCLYSKEYEKDMATSMIENGKCLRFLDLRLTWSTLQLLPKSFGKLLHLRYLDLSGNSNLQVLPKSLTKLHHLIELKLGRCSKLEELPENLRVLVNLRLLDISNCHRLIHMPIGMDNMTNLHTLTMFVVGCRSSSKHPKIGQLRDLRGLANLKGKLVIKLKHGWSYDFEGVYPLRELHLKSLVIDWERDLSEPDAVAHETLLSDLKPHFDLKELEINGYEGTKFPIWASQMESSLPHLRKIILSNFKRCEHLPSLSRLSHLKHLYVRQMYNLEFMERKKWKAPLSLSPHTIKSKFLIFFPSLERLQMEDMSNLKRWWAHKCVRGEGDATTYIPVFPRLIELSIRNCPSMTSFPCSPLLKTLYVKKFNEAMRLFDDGKDPSSSSSSSSSYSSANLCLEKIDTDNVGLLNSLTARYFLRCIYRIRISDFEGESLSKTAQAFQKCSSLAELKLASCRNLKTFCGSGIEHLSNLQTLTITNCPSLNLEENAMMTMKVWKSLSSLQLHSLPKLVHLPEWIQYLTVLQSLNLSYCNLESLEDGLQGLTSLQCLKLRSCDQLKSLPRSLRDLPSLETLEILNCKGLKERVQEHDGEDWCNIKHIPYRFTYF